MKKTVLLLLLLAIAQWGFSQRIVDKLDRGLVAQKVSKGVFLSWRILGEEYYDVTYNVYRNGVKITNTPLEVSNYTDVSGTVSNSYSVSAVVRGVEQEQCVAVKPWSTSYMEINPKHDASLLSTYVPNDACCADVDGDGELEILLKYDNQSEMAQSYPKNGPTVNGKVTHEYTLLECLKLDGTVLWWINCGPNMGDFQNNEINIVGYDWDGDGKAEVVIRAADGTTIHQADGTVFTVGSASLNYRAATGGGTNWFMHDGAEYLVYMNGETGKPYQCITYPLLRLESGENDLNAAWGDGYGHRSSKYFFGAPYLDGRKPSIFLARGIYTRHKMIAYDVDPATHKLVERWRWYNNSNGPWKGQGYHNYGIADVDWDGRDEIVFGSMVIDDNGKGLSTTGLGHGDSQHCSDFNPYVHGQEIYACNEDQPGNNYRDATTSKIYHRYNAGNDDGRAMAGNFCNDFPGGLACSAREGAISLVYNDPVDGLSATGVNTNFRIYWDGDLCSETFNYINGKNTEGCVAKYGSWTPIYTCAGSLTNNDTKGTPCYQGDILGDWREEIIMRTANNRIRIYSTPTPTQYRIYTLWHDHQYRNSMVWQMCGYNQPPHTSYYLGEMENITVAPPPLIMTNRKQVENGGTISSALNGEHVIVCETGNSTVSIEEGAAPYILTFNVPTWVQGTASSEYTSKTAAIKYTTYSCNVKGGGITGEARIVKQGDGILNLPKADFTHTGETTIWAGVLNFDGTMRQSDFDGTMRQSDLRLSRFAELNSSGEFKSLRAEYASVIRPGGESAIGTIQLAEGLDLGFGSRVIIDIDATSTNDCIKAKTISIECKTGTAWTKYGPEYVQPVIELRGKNIQAGDYVIMEAESFVGDVNDIKIEGDAIASFKPSLRFEDGKLILTLGGTRSATLVEWTGEYSNVWNFAEAENFIIPVDETPTVFAMGDVVAFNDNAIKYSVNIDGDVAPDSILVDASKSYTFQGTGSITSGALVKKGAGALTILTKNSYAGGNFLKGGTVKVNALSNDITATGNLGAVTSSPAKFTMENGAVLQSTAAVTNGSPIRMIGDEGGVINCSSDFVQQKAISGTLLTKKGAGSLFTRTANTSLTRLVIAAGAVAAQAGNPAATVEFQAGTLWDDAQATSHAIYVPKGKSGTWQLTNTYYTAYANKLTGEGTLTIVPRNTVSRVRITGNWSEFTGTIKHNTSIWLPLDASTGLPNGTLDVAAGSTVTNVCRVFRIGKLTGGGDLAHPIANFQNSSAVSGSNTWQVGNSSDALGGFSFAGRITDAGGSNKANFEKVGTCKMITSGVWDNTGTVKINEGELHFNSGSLLGKGALTVAEGARLSGVTKTNMPLTNSSYNILGELQAGSTATAYTGTIDFGGKNLTMAATSRLLLGLRSANTKEDVASGSSISNINALTINGTIAPYLYASYQPTEGDEFRLWTQVNRFLGTPSFELPEIHECKKDDNIYSIVWDTSLIDQGILKIASVQNLGTGIQAPQMAEDEQVEVQVFTLNGELLCSYYSPMGKVKAALRQTALSKGVYLLKLKSQTGKSFSMKVLR